jgi:hypothetical protein
MQHKSIADMQVEIVQLNEALRLPVPEDEKNIYRATIARIQREIDARKGPVSSPPPPVPPQPIKHTTPPPPRDFGAGAQPPIVVTTPPPPQTIEQSDHDADRTNAHYQRQAEAIAAMKTRVIHAGNQHPVNSKSPLHATIQVPADTDPYNPSITITWADGYTLTVDETAARGRFATTLRDTCALRLVAQGRYQSMWRWSSPWRAAGFYQALTHFRGAPPTLRELGILRPNEVTTQAFQHITEKAAQSA